MERRQFVKAGAVAVAGLAFGTSALELVGCGGSSGSAGGSQGITAGSFEAQSTGHNAPLVLKATFSPEHLDQIEVTKNLETIGVGAWAIDHLTHQMIETQSLNLDTVTGATISSMAFLAAMQECAKQANAVEVMQKNPGITPQVSSSYETDVCVIGGGGSGLAAAISAVQAGARVLVLEKCGIIGGSTNVSEGALNAVDPKRQEAQGITDSVETFYQATIEGGHNEGTPELVDYLTSHALESVEWMESLGVEFKDEVGSATGSMGERSHYPKTPSGNTYIRAFHQFIADHADQIEILNDMQAKELIVTDGVVTGVKALFRGEQEVTVSAKSVIISTGGFGANIAYRQEVNTGVWSHVKLDESIGCTNIQPCAQGEGLVLAKQAGAALVGLSDIQLHPCGTPKTGLMEDIRTSGRNRLFLNAEGKRFVSEGAKRDELCNAIFAQPGSTYWILVNKVRYPSETEPDANGATIENMLALNKIVKGETIQELAEKTGMNAENIQAAIDAYNDVVAGKATDEFGFKADNSKDQQLLEGPWYANQKVPTVHHTMGGIKIDVNCHALSESGEIIKNLFACGECTGGIHGSNRLGGNAIADCMTFGRVAGAQAAANAQA